MKKITYSILIMMAAMMFVACQSASNEKEVSSQEKLQDEADQVLFNQQITGDEGEPILVGLIDRSGLKQAPYGEWFDTTYAEYQPDVAALEGASEKLEAYEIELFMGTWCSDSRREVPAFYKILDQIGFDDRKLTVVSLDDHEENYKKSPQHEEEGKNIESVPTMIFYKGGEEKGRIIESPDESLEKDMMKILSL